MVLGGIRGDDTGQLLAMQMAFDLVDTGDQAFVGRVVDAIEKETAAPAAVDGEVSDAATPAAECDPEALAKVMR